MHQVHNNIDGNFKKKRKRSEQNGHNNNEENAKPFLFSDEFPEFTNILKTIKSDIVQIEFPFCHDDDFNGNLYI